MKNQIIKIGRTKYQVVSVSKTVNKRGQEMKTTYMEGRRGAGYHLIETYTRRGVVADLMSGAGKLRSIDPKSIERI